MGAGVPLDGTSAAIVAAVLMAYVFISFVVEILLEKLHHCIKHLRRPQAFLQIFEKLEQRFSKLECVLL